MSELRRSKRKSMAVVASRNESSSSAKKMKSNGLKQTQTDKQNDCDSSSSDEEFHHPVDLPKPPPRILSSQRNSAPVLDFSSIEENIFSGISRLSESDSDSDFEEVPIKPEKSSNENQALPGKIENTDGTFIRKSLPVSMPESSNEKSSSKHDSTMTNGKGRSKSMSKRENHRLKEIGKDKLESKSNSKKLSSVSSKSGKLIEGKNDEKPVRKEAMPIAAPSKHGRAVKSSDALGLAKQSELNGPKKKRNSKESGSGDTRKSSGAKMEVPEKLDNLDVSAILALGEGLKESSESPHPSDSEDDWEEVKGPDATQHSFPKGGVEITVEMPELFHRRKRRDQVASIQAEVNRNFNRARREIQILFHKVSVLAWLAHGLFVNNILNCDYLKALSMSLIPSELFLPAGKASKKDVQLVLKWFTKTIESSEGFPPVNDVRKSTPLLKSLEQQFSRKVARSQREQVLMFVCALRAAGIDARLIISFRPMPLKPPSRDLLPVNPKTKLKGEDDKASGVESEKKQSSVEAVKKQIQKRAHPKSSPSSSKDSVKNIDSDVKRSSSTTSKKEQELKQKSHPSSPKKMRELRKRPARKSYVEKSVSEESSSDEEPILSPNQRKSLDPEEKGRLKAAAAKRTRGRRALVQAVNSKASCSKDSNRKLTPSPAKKHSSPKPSVSYKCDSEDSLGDSDFEPKRKSSTQSSGDKCSPKKRKRTSSKGKGIKVISSEDEFDEALVSNCSDFWVEVYLETEEKWVPIDVISGKIDSVKEILAKASHPVCYVVAFNADKTVKDVTKRYSPKFSQVTVKLRASHDWWEKSLRCFKPKRTSKEIQEDSEMNLVELDRPMPTKIGECKNHPLYVLKRHLLKFEAIYPPDAPTLGFLPKGEAIYARQNVYTLHSRELWIKEAKVVRLGEKPYKIVKARPKWDKVNCKVLTDLPLEVFGPWQVEDYVPPPAVDGKVPRNAYGNVELFKPTMLPKGCVHLQVPGLNRVAKKLKIDCAPAVVGFEYHCGGSYPSYDGFVVCEEFVDQLMDAWNRDIDESAKRREEKHEKRVYGNWRRLIKGLLIREHLKHRYNFKEDPNHLEPGPSQSSVNPEALKSSRITEDEPALPVLFPKLMARMKAQKKTSQSAKRKSSVPKLQQGKKVSSAKAKPRRKKKKSETSDEEDGTDWDSSSTSQDESEMVLLSEEESGSDLD